jgi:hypothetical protein
MAAVRADEENFQEGLALCGCGKSSDWSNQLRVTISGPSNIVTVPILVRDCNSLVPIPNARVCVVSDGCGGIDLGCKYTDAAGQTSFTGCAGTWTVTVSASGYITNSLTNYIQPPPASTSMDFRLCTASLNAAVTQTQSTELQVGTGEVTKTQAEAPTVTISPDTGELTFQSGAKVDLTASVEGGSGTMTYQWFKGTDAVGENKETYSATSEGSYTVMVTDANGCSGTSDPVEIMPAEDCLAEVI